MEKSLAMNNMLISVHAEIASSCFRFLCRLGFSPTNQLIIKLDAGLQPDLQKITPTSWRERIKPHTTYLITILTTFLCINAHAADWQYSGHSKYQFIYNTYPDDSIFREAANANTLDHNIDIRLKTRLKLQQWDVNTDYQLFGLYGDSLKAFEQFSELPLINSAIINDDHRLWDLTHVIEEENKHAALHRLDRFNIGYIGEKTVIRLGRQAVSWGNGLIYSPMDIFNPFDPTSVDKEYKTGDDMLYGQYLQNNGNDLQMVYVARRESTTGNIESHEASLAFKYHLMFNDTEIDLLLAHHYDDDIVGIGSATSLGEAIWRGDVTFTFIDQQTTLDTNQNQQETSNEVIASLVTSLSYSWILWDTNFSGNLEYL